MSVNSPYYNEPGVPSPTVELPVVESTAMLARISWGAVISGVVLAIGIQILLSMLGTGIGFSTIDPIQGDSPSANTIGLSAWLWWTLSNLIAMFMAGWIAGYLAGIPRRLDGMLHGVLSWCLATIVVLTVLGTALGSIISGTAGMIQSGIRMVAPQVEEYARDNGINLGQLRADARDLLAGRSSTDTQSFSDAELDSMINSLFSGGSVSPQNREKIISALDERTNMSRSEAENVVQQWETTYKRVIGENGQQAREVADKTAKAVSQASLWGFLTFLISAIAAAIGGMMGIPFRKATVRSRTDTPTRRNPNLRIPPATPQQR